MAVDMGQVKVTSATVISEWGIAPSSRLNLAVDSVNSASL